MDNTAISVGIAIQSGVVLQKCGNYWCRIGTSQTVDSSLINRATTNIVPIGTTSLTYWASRDCSNGWFQTSASTGQYKPNDATIFNCYYNSVTGLYFDSGNSQREWYLANSLCSSKGMRLPTNMEVGSSKIPSYISWTWTSTRYDSQMFVHFVGNYFNDGGYDSWSFYVRCVK